MSIFCDRFKQLKEESGILLKDLSEATGISVPNLSYYMKGREPNYEVLCKIANYFNVTTDYLVGRINHKHFDEEKLAQEIKGKSDNSFINDKREADIENASVQIHNILSDFAKIEFNGKNVDEVWKMVKIWLEGLKSYYKFIDTLNPPNYPLDEAKKAMDTLSIAIKPSTKRVGDMLEQILREENIDKNIKDRVLIKSTFGILSEKKNADIVSSQENDL